MRIVLTKVGKEEISKDYSQEENIILNTDNNIEGMNSYLNNIINKKNLNFIPKSKSLNKYKNNAFFNKNNISSYKGNNNKNKSILLKAGIYSINKNYSPNDYKDPFNRLFRKNNKKKDLPLKLISLNESVFTLPNKAKILYLNEKNNKKNEFEKINITNNNIKKDNDIINNKDNSFLNSGNLSLPKINLKRGLSLKDILKSKNKKNLDDSLLFKEININETSLINYLKLDKSIPPSFVKKINQANEQKLFQLDKICQKYFQNEKERIILKNKLQKKIKKEYSKDSEYCKNGLKNMKYALKGIENIYKDYSIKMENIRENKKYNMFIRK